MNIVPIPAFTDNYIWLIIDEQQHLFDCVDPGDAEPVIQYAKAKQLNLRTLLLTHHHDDHIGGVAELKKAFPNCQIFGPSDERIPHRTHTVKKGDSLKIGSYEYQVLSNPGHTSSHISYYEPKQGWLFCGDTLFSGGCGRVFDGTMEQLHQSINLFKGLPANTKVFCAHEYTRQNLRFAQFVEPDNEEIKRYIEQLDKQEELCSLPSTIEEELVINPFFRTHVPGVQSFAIKHGASSKDSFSVFEVLRNEKNIFK